MSDSLSSPPTTTTAAAATKQQKYFERSSDAASATSFYTTEEKKDSYSTLSEILEAKCDDPLVRHVIQDLMKVCADITDALRTSLVTVEGTSNDFGDSQLSVDVRSVYIYIYVATIVMCCRTAVIYTLPKYDDR